LLIENQVKNDLPCVAKSSPFNVNLHKGQKGGTKLRKLKDGPDSALIKSL
jgi:hypothetical protein